MKRSFGIALACLAALTVSACGTLGTIGNVVTHGPVVVADQSKLDEQLGLSLTLAYTAASKGAALAINTADLIGKPFSTATVKRIGELDAAAFAAVTAVRQAYLAGNSSNYLAAISQARQAVTNLLGAFSSKPVAWRTPNRPPTYDAAYFGARVGHYQLTLTAGGDRA